MKKQIVCMTIALSLLLTACGQQPVSSELTARHKTATLFCDVGFWKIPVWNTDEGTITGRITQKTGLALDVITPSQEADTQLKIMMIDDELPDIISLTDSTTISQVVTSGKVWKLDEFLETYLPGSHLLKDFPDDIKRELIKRDGAWYSLPSHINSTDARTYWKSSEYVENFVLHNDNNAIIWNISLLEQMGLQIENLQTEEQVLAAYESAVGMETETGPVIPVLVDGKMYLDPTMKYLLGTFGAEWVDEQGHYRDIYLQPEAKDALRFMNTLMRNRYMTPDQLMLEVVDTQRLMNSGRILCFIGNVANISAPYEKWISSGPILSSSGSTPVHGKNLRAPVGWIQTFISKSCQDPAEIAAFIDYMTSEEGLSCWSYGIEGTHYTVDGDGAYHRMEGWEDATENYQSTGLAAWWMFSNMAWERSVQPTPDAAKVHEDSLCTAYGASEYTRTYDASLLIMPTNLIPVESEEGKIQQAADAWKQEQIMQIIFADDAEEFELRYERFIQGLYDLGIEQLDEKINEGYQANCWEYGSYIPKVNRTERPVAP